MHRFYSADHSVAEKIISITNPQEIHHIKNVLRLRKGDNVLIFDAAGQEAEGTLKEINPTDIKILITQRNDRSFPLGLTVILACAIPKKSKFETIIEKTTELGVHEIIPLITARTEVRFPKQDLVHKQNRYQAVAINAAKQSQRSHIPIIHEATPFNKFLKKIPPDSIFFIPCLIGKRQHISEVFAPPALKKFRNMKILFCIGPEGDFTPEEVKAALASGAIPLSLCDTVLKVDTAAIVSVAIARLAAPIGSS